MKKILISIVFIGLTISAFATPTCTNYPALANGIQNPLTNDIWYNVGGNPDDEPNYPLGAPFTFECDLSGVDGTYYYVLFAYQGAPSKSQKLSDMEQIKKGSMTQFVPNTKNNNKNVQNHSQKIWVPESGPVMITSINNGSTLLTTWQDGLGNQGDFDGLPANFPYLFIGICENPDDLNTCNVILDGGPSYFSAFAYYIGNTEQQDDGIKTSYAAMQPMRAEFYVMDSMFPAYDLTAQQAREGNLEELLADTLVVDPIYTDVVTPPSDEVYYKYLPELSSTGTYYIFKRFIMDPDQIATDGLRMASYGVGSFVYDYNSSVDEIKKDILNIKMSNTQPGSEYVGIELPAGYSNGSLVIYDMSGKKIDTARLQEGMNKISNPSKKGTYIYVIMDENNKILNRKKVIR